MSKSRAVQKMGFELHCAKERMPYPGCEPWEDWLGPLVVFRVSPDDRRAATLYRGILNL